MEIGELILMCLSLALLWNCQRRNLHHCSRIIHSIIRLYPCIMWSFAYVIGSICICTQFHHICCFAPSPFFLELEISERMPWLRALTRVRVRARILESVVSNAKCATCFDLPLELVMAEIGRRIADYEYFTCTLTELALACYAVSYCMKMNSE